MQTYAPGSSTDSEYWFIHFKPLFLSGGRRAGSPRRTRKSKYFSFQHLYEFWWLYSLLYTKTGPSKIGYVITQPGFWSTSVPLSPGSGVPKLFLLLVPLCQVRAFLVPPQKIGRCILLYKRYISCSVTQGSSYPLMFNLLPLGGTSTPGWEALPWVNQQAMKQESPRQGFLGHFGHVVEPTLLRSLYSEKWFDIQDFTNFTAAYFFEKCHTVNSSQNPISAAWTSNSTLSVITQDS